MSEFAGRLLKEWRRVALPTTDRIVIAVSGGADSTALLLAFDELVKAELIEVKITVAHLNHGLRGEAGEADARWVAELAEELGYEIVTASVPVAVRASSGRDNMEQAARRARYEFLSETAHSCEAGVILTAHTLDDQAETVLLCLLRGSGTEGLGGMRPLRVLEAGSSVLLIRPFLSWARRMDTENHCRARGVQFRSDEMNKDERFARVRVRRKLLPLLETFNPRVVEAIARTAELLREDEAALADQAAKLLDEASGNEGEVDKGIAEVGPLRVEALTNAPIAVRRRALRQWIKQGRGDLRRIELAHIVAVEKLLVGERGGRVAELPGGGFIERRRGWLRFHAKKVEKA